MDALSEPVRSDEDLLSAARHGDRAALEALLERHEAQVFRFGLKMCRNQEDAKDVLQETLIAMARSVGDFKGRSSLATWLYTIARSYCIKKRRRSKFAPAVEDSLEQERPALRVAAPGRGPEDVVAGRQLEAALEQAIGSLKPMYREVMVLRDVEGLTAPEVARILGLSVETVKTRLHRARLMVREKVAPVLGLALPAAPPPAGKKRCPDTLHVLSRYLEGDIGPEVCARMEAHVSECDFCRTACDSLKRVLTLCRTVATPGVPGAVQASVRSAVRDLLEGCR